MPRRLLLAGLVAALALLALAPAAPADDASVLRAWNSEEAAFAENDRQIHRGLRAFKRSDDRRPGRLLRALRRFERLVGIIDARVRAEQPSTATGAEARRMALRSDASILRSSRALRGCIRAASRRRAGAVRRLCGRSEREERRATRQMRRAKGLFAQAAREAQASSPPPSESQPSSPPPQQQQQPSDEPSGSPFPALPRLPV